MNAQSPLGFIDAIHGPVVDVHTHYLPPLNQALTVADQGSPVLLEVYQHLDANRVRTIASAGNCG